MKILSFTLLFLLLLQSCDKENESAPAEVLNGTYTGNFHRTGMDTVGISITFTDNKFTGYSARQKYPAICQGSWETSGSTITFTDSCNWTADFDWTLILNGNYNFSVQADNKIRIWRLTGAIKDEYLIWRPVR